MLPMTKCLRFIIPKEMNWFPVDMTYAFTNETNGRKGPCDLYDAYQVRFIVGLPLW